MALDKDCRYTTQMCLWPTTDRHILIVKQYFYTNYRLYMYSVFSRRPFLPGDQVNTNEMGRACSTYGWGKRCINGFDGEPEGKEPLERPWVGWEYNIKMAFQDIGWEGVDWIDLAQDRDKWRAVVNRVMNNSIYPFTAPIRNILNSLSLWRQNFL